MNLKHKDWPKLKKAWDDYGFNIPFEQCDRIRQRQDGLYVLVGWKTPEGTIDAADFCFLEGAWEVQNDGMGNEMSEKEWDSIVMDPWCDTFKYTKDKP